MLTKQERNKLFIDKVNESLEMKIFRNRREIVDKLGWSETALSSVMAGNRGVPEEKANAFFELINNVKKSPDSGTPIYDLTATASGNDNVSQLPELPSFHVKMPGYEDCNFGMYVFGHSMYPTIETGSLVLCRKVRDKRLFMFGEIYLIRTGDYLMVKRIQKSTETGCVLCTSDNFEKRTPDYRRFEPFDLPIDSIIDLYLVKGIIKKTQS